MRSLGSARSVRRVLACLILAVVAAATSSGAEAPSPAKGKKAAATAPSPAESAPGLDVSGVIEQVQHYVAPNGPGALRVTDERYQADFTAAGFSMTLPQGRTFPAAADATIATRTVSVGGAPMPAAPQLWTGKNNTASRVVAPAVTERVTAKNHALEWDYILAAAPNGDVEIAAGLTGGVPSIVSMPGGDDFLRVPVRGGNAIRIGRLIVVDANGKKLHTALPVFDDGLLRLRVPARALRGAAYPVTIDPTVSPEYGPATSPTVAADSSVFSVASNGSRWLVVWQDTRTQPSSGTDIYAARIESDGTLMDQLGIPIARPSGNQTNPSVSWNGSNFIVVWQDEREPDSPWVMAARVSAAGSLLDSNGILVSVVSKGAPRISSAGSTSLVVWQQGGFGTTWIEAQRLDATAAPLGSPFIVDSADTGDQPTVTSSASTFFVAWRDLRTGTPQIYGARVTTAGVVTDASNIALTSTTGSKRAPNAAWNGTNFAVAFMNDVNQLFVARVSTAGTVLDPSGDFIATISSGFGVSTTPVIAAVGSSFLVAYQMEDFTGPFVRARRLNSDLTANGAEIAIGSGYVVAVASNGTNYFVAWQGSFLLGSRITTAGGVLEPGGTVIAQKSASQNGSTVAWDGTNFLILWGQVSSSGSGLQDLRATRITPEGLVLDPAGIVVSAAAESKYSPSVVFDGTNYLISWSNLDVVRATRISPAGTVLDGTGFAVASLVGVSFDEPAAASSGGFTLITMRRRQGLSTDIVGVRVTGNTILDTTPIDIAVSGSSAREPAVAFTQGHFLVTWVDDRAGNSDIYGGRVATNGTTLDGNGFGIATSSSPESTASIAYGDGVAMVAWTHQSGLFDVRAVRVNGLGQLLGSSFAIAATSAAESLPSVAWNGGTFITAWQNRPTAGDPADAMAVRITSAGAILDSPPIPVAATPDSEGAPSLIHGVTDRVAVAYSRWSPVHNGERVFLRYLDDARNDAFADARTITGNSGSLTGVNIGTGEEAGEPPHANPIGTGASVWFAWTPPNGGTATINTTNSRYDTTLAAYTGDAVNALTLLAENDDFNATTQSQITFPVRAGRTYRIAVDGFGGGTGEIRAAWSLVVDSTAPQTTIDSGPSGTVSDSYAVFAFSSSEPNSTFECSLDGQPFEDCITPKTYTGLVPGSHTFAVRGTDQAGNTDASPATRTWTIDASPPETTIVTGPSGTTSSTSATFTFSSDDPAATFQCSLDGAGYSACSSPAIYSGLVTGSHTFLVRARDAGGNLDATPASRTWTVDATAPDTTIDSGPASVTNATSATLTFSSSEGASTFECKLDGGAYAPCTSPVTYSALTNGSHTVLVKATDAAGNPDPTPASRTWTVDTAAPDTTITGGPSGPITQSSATFTFTATESATFACSLDAAPYQACSSPATFSGLSDAAHTFAVRATDAAGNTDGTPASRSFSVDTAAPVTTIDSGPPGVSASSSATFTFHASEGGVTYQCSLDAGAFGNCSSPVTYTGLADGQHSFRVRATDAAGNVEAAPPSHGWRSDTTTPETTITTGPSALTSETSAAIGFTASEAGATFACSLDGGSFMSCTSPATYTGLANGAHTFAVRATDDAGNTDPTAATRSWTVDTVAPDTTIASGPSGTTASRDATIAFTATEAGSTFACSLDGAGYSGCTSPVSLTTLADGPHTFAVRSTDPAGNTDGTPASISWIVDASPPDTTITGGPSGTVATANASFSFTSEPGSTFGCSLDGAGFAPCTSPHAYSGLTDGSHTFAVRATDAAGNLDTSAATRTWTIDTTAPDTAIQSGPSGTVTTTAATFAFSADDPGASLTCSIDGSAFGACTSPKSYTGLGEGEHTFRVRATDAAGNADASPASRTWTIDTVAPDTSITGGPSAVTNATNATITFSSPEAGATFTCRLDGGPYAACTSPAVYPALAEGNHTFDVRAADAAGNADVTPASWAWRVDVTAPNTTITSGPAPIINTTGTSITFTSSETGSVFACSLDGAPFAGCSSPVTLSSLSEGAHTFNVRATDAAGNSDASPATRSWTVDLTAPDTTITSGPSGAITSSSAAFQFTADEAASFQCSMDAGAFSSCTSPAAYSGLSQGAHTFRVRATDTAGNQDATAASRSFTVDSAPPVVSIRRPTGGLWAGDALIAPGGSIPIVAGSITVIANASDAGSGIASFRFEVDGTAVDPGLVSYDPVSGDYSFVYTPTTAGMHSIVARATDAAGGSAVASVQIVAIQV